jgi:cytidylate kinase
LEIRIRRIMLGLGLDRESAHKEIERVEGSRHAFIKRYFKAELDDPANYDLSVNTEHLDFNDATSLIVHAMGLKHLA